MNWTKLHILLIIIIIYGCSPVKDRQKLPEGQNTLHSGQQEKNKSLWFKIKAQKTDGTYAFHLLKQKTIDAKTKGIFYSRLSGNAVRNGQWQIRFAGTEKTVYTLPYDNPFIRRYEVADDHGELHSHEVRLDSTVIHLRIPYADNLKNIIFEEKKGGKIHSLGVVHLR